MITSDLFGQPLRVAGTLPLFGATPNARHAPQKSSAQPYYPPHWPNRPPPPIPAPAGPVGADPIMSANGYELERSADSTAYVLRDGTEAYTINGRAASALEDELMIGDDGQAACSRRTFLDFCGRVVVAESGNGQNAQ